MDPENLVQRLTQGVNQSTIQQAQYSVRQTETSTSNNFLERSPSRYQTKTINASGTPRQTVIYTDKQQIPISPSTQLAYVTTQQGVYQSPVATQATNQSARQIIVSSQPSTQRTIQASTNTQSSETYAHQLQQQLSQYGTVVREGNKFIVKQTIPQPIQIQEKIVEVEKPVYYEKQIYVENREEIESLKQRIIQLQNLNQDYWVEINSLRSRPIEVQTQEKITYVEDSTKIRELEAKIQRLLHEIETINQVIRSQKEEIEIYRKNYFELENKLKQQVDLNISYQRETDVLRNKLNELNEISIQEKEILRRQSEEWQIRFSQIQTEYRDYETYRTRYQVLLDDLERLKGENSRYIEQIFKYESRLKEYSGYDEEIQRLRRHLEIKDNDLKEWSSRYSNLEIRIRELQEQNLRIGQLTILEADNKKLIELLEQKKREADEWSLRFKNISIEYQDYQSRYRNTEERIVFLSTELERYKNQYSKYQDYDIKIKEYETRIRDYESRFSFLRKESEEKIQRLVDEIKSLNNTLRIKSEETDQLRAQYKQIEVRIYEINNLTQENKRFQDIIASKSRENEELRIRISQQESKIVQVKEFEGRIALLTSELERMRNAYNQKTSEVDDIRKSTRTLVIREYDDRISGLSQQLEQTNRAYSAKVQEIEELRRKLSSNKDYERVLQEYEQRIQILISEKERIQNNYTLKLREFDEFRVKYNDNDTRIRDYELKIQSLTADLERIQVFYREKQQENQNMRVSLTKTSEYEVKVREYEKSISVYRSDNENLKQRIFQLQQELEDYRSRSTQVTIYQTRIREYEDKLTLLSQELDRLRTNSGKSIDLEAKIVMMSTEIERLNNQLVIKENENNGLRSKYIREIEEWKQKSMRSSQVEENVAYLKREIQRLEQLNDALKRDEAAFKRNHYSSSEGILAENTRLRERIQQLETDLFRYRGSVDEVTTIRTSTAYQSNLGNNQRVLGTVIVSPSSAIRTSQQITEEQKILTRSSTNKNL